MVRPFIALCGLSWGVLCAMAGPINQSGSDDQLGDSVREAARSIGVDSEPLQSTARDVLKALQTQRPLNVVIPPGSVRDGGGQTPPAALYPEGWAFVSQSGRLVRRDSRWVFAFDGAEDERSLTLLPNAILEGMARSSAGASSQLRFVVSGELTVYRDENYLLPRLALRSNASTIEPPGPDGAAGSHAQTSDGPTNPEQSAVEVVKILQEQFPTRQAIPVGSSSPQSRDDKRAVVSRALLPDGAPLVDRPGRLVDEGLWWTFVFESDNPDRPEPPMKLLQNQNVELMTDASHRGELGLVFIVSGEVTVFNGENYLLPRVVMRRIDSGNLTK